MVVSFQGNSSEISLKSAEMLFNPHIANSLTNNGNLWEASSQGDSQATKLLSSSFSISGKISKSQIVIIRS
jgi:hypothetical protein